MSHANIGKSLIYKNNNLIVERVQSVLSAKE